MISSEATLEQTLEKQVKKSIVLSTVLKFASVGVNFVLIRVSYDYLQSNALYGIWVTMLSFLTFFNLLNFGIGDVLRNKIASALSLNDTNLAREELSTGYLIAAIFAVANIALFLLLLPFLNWFSIFNVSGVPYNELQNAVIVITICYLAQLALSLINSVCFALQDATFPSLITFLVNALVVVVLFELKYFNIHSFFLLAALYAGLSIAVLAASTYYLYKKRYQMIRPSYKYVNRKRISGLLGSSIKFFALQVAAVIIYSTDNIVIIQLLSPADVASYQIVLKVFSLFTIASGIIMTPMWSAYSFAYARGDFDWISRMIRKLLLLLIPFIAGIVLMVAAARPIIQLWMGDSVKVTFALIVFMAIYTLVIIWNSIFGYLLNGINRINYQLIALIIGACLNIPLAIFFVKHAGMGVEGVLFGTLIALSLFSLTGPLEAVLLLRKRKSHYDREGRE